jgi:hypothetical protein
LLDLYRVAFKMLTKDKAREIARSIASTYLYNVWYVPTNGALGEHFKIGTYLEVMGMFESLVLLIIASLLVSSTMATVVQERRKETFIFVTTGANPTHIAILFFAESITLGLLGGLFGYLGGLSLYRLFALFGGQVVVREKLEWYWSVISVLIAVGASVLATVKPSMDAAVEYSKAFKRKVAVTKQEREKREEKIFRVYQEMGQSLPLRLTELEYPFFSGFVIRRLSEQSIAHKEWIEGIAEKETEEDGNIVRKLEFTYFWVEAGEEYLVESVVRAVKLPREGVYRLEMMIRPKKPGTPTSIAFRPIHTMQEIIGEWDKEKKRIMGGG